MASFEDLILVRDFADVVPVTQHLLDLRVRDGASRPASSRSREETTVSKFIGDVLVGVFPRGEELERELYEWRSLRVDRDCVDFPSVDVLGDIEIAEWSATKRSTVLGLLRHLVGDVGPILAGAVLVEGGEDAVHELAYRRGVDRLGRRDEFNATLLKVGHDDRVIDAVSCEA
nr:hypothetical protein [Microbacterium sp.]